MRMFLIAVCDVFLLLYLSSLTNISPDLLSDVTLEDYKTLEQKREELEKELEQELAELSSVREELKEEKKALEKVEAAKLKETEVRLSLAEELSSTREKLETELEEERARLAELNEAKRTELDALRAQAEAIEKSRAELAGQKKQLASELSKKTAELGELAKAVEILKLRQAAAEEKALTAERDVAAVTDRADNLASLSEQLRAQRAQDELALQALEQQLAQVQVAREQAEQNLIQSEQEIGRLSKNLRDSQFEQTLAKVRDQVSTKDTDELVRAVGRVFAPGTPAYIETVLRRTVELELAIRSLDKELLNVSLRLPVVELEQEQYVLFPLASVLPRSDTIREDLLASFRVRGSAPSELFVSPFNPKVLALRLPAEGRILQPAKVEDLSFAIPVILAILPEEKEPRPRVFDAGRLRRSANSEYRFVPRDAWALGGKSKALPAGSYLFDASGNFIAIANRPNRFRVVDSISGWTKVSLRSDGRISLPLIAQFSG